MDPDQVERRALKILAALIDGHVITLEGRVYGWSGDHRHPVVLRATKTIHGQEPEEIWLVADHFDLAELLRVARDMPDHQYDALVLDAQMARWSRRKASRRSRLTNQDGAV